eukprot:GHVU01174194.1.p1 GENE.GHVU01174194.1~~GHVU01174194.1.p1  ORF type:complete len:133 (+),score=2.07 GHVU01174194.1:260-658(+)
MRLAREEENDRQGTSNSLETPSGRSLESRRVETLVRAAMGLSPLRWFHCQPEVPRGSMWRRREGLFAGATTTDAQVGCRPKILLKAVRSICCDSLGAYLFVRLPAAFSPGWAATSVNADELDLPASSGVCQE